MTTVTVTRDNIVKLIRGTGGKFFSVTFIKRSNGSKRLMICRAGVKKYLTPNEGKERNFNPSHHDLIPTFSVDSLGYRHISIEGIQEAKIGGVRYVVE